MYTISELNEMSDLDLKAVAEGMGLKRINTSEKEKLVYRILYHQAETGAAASTAERKRRTTKPTAEGDATAKKRGRKKKDTAAKPQAAETAEADATAAEAVATEEASRNTPEGAQTPEKKRRGRPRKQASEAEQSEAPQAEAAEAAEPAHDNSEVVAEAPAAPAESAAQEEKTEAAPAQENAAQDNKDNNTTGAEGTEQGEQEQQQQRRSFMPSKDSSLGAFFPRSEGRKFVPRSQREKEAATTNAPAAPIVLAEPNQPAQQGMGKRNKKNRQNQQQNHNNQQQQYQQQRYDFEGLLETTGVLEIVPEGYGFLRSADFNYLASPDDVYVTMPQIKSYGLRAGDVVEATIRPPREGEKYFPMTGVKRVNGRSLEFIRDRMSFEHLTPLFPDEKFNLTGGRRSCTLSTRVVDMFSPIGKGQRGLIVAPPKTGKTLLLKDIANAIAENHPETYIMILLID